jgi:hypothetical protein
MGMSCHRNKNIIQGVMLRHAKRRLDLSLH